MWQRPLLILRGETPPRNHLADAHRRRAHSDCCICSQAQRASGIFSLSREEVGGPSSKHLLLNESTRRYNLGYILQWEQKISCPATSLPGLRFKVNSFLKTKKQLRDPKPIEHEKKRCPLHHVPDPAPVQFYLAHPNNCVPNPSLSGMGTSSEIQPKP